MSRRGDSPTETIAALAIAFAFAAFVLVTEPWWNTYTARDSRGRKYKIHADYVPQHRKEQIRSGERKYAADYWGTPEKESNYWGGR